MCRILDNSIIFYDMNATFCRFGIKSNMSISECEVEYSRAERALSRFSELKGFWGPEHCVLAVGSTYLSYNQLAGGLQTRGAQLLNYSNHLPWYLWLNPFVWVASKAKSVLIQINNPSEIHSIFKCLGDFSSFEVIVVPQLSADDVVSDLQEGEYIRGSSKLYEEPSHFVYGVDTDNPDYETGILEFYSYGVSAPDTLVRAIQL